MPAAGAAWLDTVVPSTVVTSGASQSGTLTPPYSAQQIAVIANVTAYVSGTATFEVQWSFDGVNFYSADQSSAGSATQVKDTFAGIAGVATLYKVVPVRAPYYRINWTTGSYTFNIQAGPAAPLASGSAAPDSGVLGASSFIGQLGSPGYVYSPQFTYLPSATLTGAAFTAGGTPASTTVSSIVAVPLVASEVEAMPVNRMTLKLNVTTLTGTSAALGVFWSYTNTGAAGTLWSADPTDTFAAITAAEDVIKELVVKGPYFAIGTVSGTFTVATFTGDIC